MFLHATRLQENNLRLQNKRSENKFRLKNRRLENNLWWHIENLWLENNFWLKSIRLWTLLVVVTVTVMIVVAQIIHSKYLRSVVG